MCHDCGDKLVEYHLFRLLVIQSQQKLLQKPTQSTIKFDITFVGEEDAHEETDQSAIEVYNYSEDEKCETVYLETEKTEEIIVDEEFELATKETFESVKNTAKLASESNFRDRLQSVHGSRSTLIVNANGSQLKEGNVYATGKQLICEKCSRSFQRRSAFLKHYRYVHLKELFQSKIRCPLCPRQFSGTGMPESMPRTICHVITYSFHCFR